MARQQTQPVVETDVLGNKEDWGEDYYGRQVKKMAKEWEQRDHKESEGLGKDITAWRRRQKTPYDKPHPMEQRPVKLAPFPGNVESTPSRRPSRRRPIFQG